jgi:hypothetical protein
MTLSAGLISIASTGCHGSGMPKHANAPILLSDGTGTSPEDVAALEKFLSSEHLDCARVDSAQLDGMSQAQIREYRLLIVPGGNFERIGNRLTSANDHSYLRTRYRMV